MRSVYNLPLSDFKTQKAKGIAAIARAYGFDNSCFALSNKGTSGNLCASALVWPHDKEIIERAHGVFFMRPCPEKPRHGFIPSKTRSVKELNKLVKNVTEADPNGEIVLMPKYEATHSAVATPKSITISRGHAGATDGSHLILNLVFPTVTAKYVGRFGDVPHSSVDITYPYYEILYNDVLPKGELVQIRDGIEPATAQHYIPYAFESNQYRTVNPFMDLLEWEQEAAIIGAQNAVDTMQGLPPTVVAMPSGMTLTSHVGIHCILNKIPVLNMGDTDVYCKVTSKFTYHATTATESPYSKWDFYDLARRLKNQKEHSHYYDALPFYATLAPIKSHMFHSRTMHALKGMAKATLIAAHHCQWWHPTPFTYNCVAVSVINYVRLATAMCMGERRHKASYNGSTKLNPIPTTVSNKDWCFLDNSKDRSHAWLRAFLFDWIDTGKLLKQLVEDFNAPGWNKGYGGEKWANCASTVLALYEGINTFISHPSKLVWDDIMIKWHESINATHNGSVPMLTKIIDTIDFTTAVIDPVSLAVHPSTILALTGRHHL